MAPSPKPDHRLNLNYLPKLSSTQPESESSTTNTSPIEPPTANPVRSPFGNPGSNASVTGPTGSSRLGAGSPSHDIGGRLFSKRAREIQAQEGLTPMWGPPASGGSTPLRETIPESPSQDGFPDFMPPSENNTQSSARRVRAGTVPSKFSPGGVTPGTGSPASLPPKSLRPTPSTSPFRSSSLVSNDVRENNVAFSSSTSALLSRLRAGSMPQRTNFVESTNPFGPSVFSAGWVGGRERAPTLQTVRSTDAPESPAHSTFSKDGLIDTDVKTLDYLGLAETPRQSQATLVQPGMTRLTVQPFLGDLAGFNRNLNRFRSYSVNAKEKYAEEEDEYYQIGQYSENHSGVMTPMEASTAAAIAATQAQIHQHNLAVQAFANQASASRPRARTAGVLDSPLRSGRNYLATPSRLDKSMTPADIRITDGLEYSGLPEAVQALHLNGLTDRTTLDNSDEASGDGPTRALWLGNIPTSTTISSLQAIFVAYGNIDSARVLVHKNCGFVNFENVESAIKAKSSLNGKEIFPGAGPIRIGYAKAPSASANGTPGNNDGFQSRSPDPFSNSQAENREASNSEATNGNRPASGIHAHNSAGALEIANLSDLRDEMMQIVRELGASSSDQIQIARSIDAAIAFTNFETEILPVPEPSHTRVHDAPKLREIRKRIDNNAITQAEVEEIAVGMLPEIAELASDYLGNTVVQKLFEFCSESIKEQMLMQIDPHLAEIGVHKNGTWAAQKVIDVAKIPSQIGIIVDSLRPYTVALFLDQYGNYVLQCCLRFGFPWNNFIFETMLSRMWDIAQGRFGARAMRACLESHHATKDQQRLLASAIALHSVQLATNANGALLLTWFLDTCTFPQRRVVLAPKLVPHLVHLCTHKVAYLTVLKVINQRNEPDARDITLQALFFSENDKTLEDILSDQACGATLIFKILTTPFFDEKLRVDVVQNIRNVLCRLKASPSQGYKRLMDEVGLSARIGKPDRETHNNSRPGSRQDRTRPVSQHGSSSGRKHQTDMERQYSNQFYQPSAQQQFPIQAGIPVSSVMDQGGFSAYEQFAPSFSTAQLNPQFQQAILAASARGITSGEFYPGMTAAGLSGYIPAAMDTSFRNMQAQPSSMAQRPMQISQSPMIQQSSFGVPSGFNQVMGNSTIASGYQYPIQYFPPQQVIQQQSGGRRGRR